MEQYITFSQLNDFLYSPASLYLHSAYVDFDDRTHKARAQMAGKFKHETIDAGTYSTRADIISGKSVWSESLGVGGKIDIYDARDKHLIERKSRVKKIHEGYLLQIYAQVCALEESGMSVSRISLHSLDDNKRYTIPIPTDNDRKRLHDVITCIREVDAEALTRKHTDILGAQSIYGQLQW